MTEEFPADEREEFEDEVVVAATAARTPEELKREIAALGDAGRSGPQSPRQRHRPQVVRAAPAAGDQPHGPRRRRQRPQDHHLHRAPGHAATTWWSARRELLGPRGSVVSIHGGLGRDQRLSVQRRFTTDPRCRVLIATDAAGEGLNLQVAHLMVNYDLPWNPNRSSSGSAGSTASASRRCATCGTSSPARPARARSTSGCCEKLDEMGEALGGKVFDVLGEVFEGHPLHQLLIEAVRHGDDPEVRQHLQTVIDERVGDLAQRLIEERALSPEVYRLGAHGRYQREVQQAERRRLQPYYVEGFFKRRVRQGRRADHPAGGGALGDTPHPIGVRDFDRAVTLPVRYPLVCFDPGCAELEARPSRTARPGRPLFDLVAAIHRERTASADQREPSSSTGWTPSIGPGCWRRSRARSSTAQANRSTAASASSRSTRTTAAPRHGPVPRLRRRRRPSELALTKDLIGQPWLAQAARTAETWATSVDLPPWYAEVNERRRQQVARARELVTDRLKQEIGHWEGARPEPKQRRPTRAARRRAQRGAEVHALRARLTRRLAELRRRSPPASSRPVCWPSPWSSRKGCGPSGRPAPDQRPSRSSPCHAGRLGGRAPAGSGAANDAAQQPRLRRHVGRWARASWSSSR